MKLALALLALLVASLAAAQTAEVALNLPDGSSLLSDKVSLQTPDGCTDCGVLPVSGSGGGGAK